jgi:hypothetical protein
MIKQSKMIEFFGKRFGYVGRNDYFCGAKRLIKNDVTINQKDDGD